MPQLFSYQNYYFPIGYLFQVRHTKKMVIYFLYRQWSIMWNIWTFTKLHLNWMQICHLRTGIIIRNSINIALLSIMKTISIGLYIALRAICNIFLFLTSLQKLFLFLQSSNYILMAANDYFSPEIRQTLLFYLYRACKKQNQRTVTFTSMTVLCM